MGVDADERGTGSGDLSEESIRQAIPGRPFRVYPALVSTHADAMAWAREGADAGAVVVADYQASPRGRAGLPWEVRPGHGLGCSMVVRPELPSEREGWLYAVTARALADVAAEDGGGLGLTINWPDEVFAGDDRVAATGVHAELGPERIDWGVLTMLVEDVEPPREAVLARLVQALEERSAQTPEDLLASYLPLCATLGRRVRAQLIPAGPTGPAVVGQADDVLDDGALVVVTDKGNRVAIRPQNLGRLEVDPDDDEEPDDGNEAAPEDSY